MLLKFQWHTEKFWPVLDFGPGFNSTPPLKITYGSQIHKTSQMNSLVETGIKYGNCKYKKWLS